MHKQVILIMESSQYPFGQFTEQSGPSSKLSIRTLVRKIHQTKSLQQRNLLLDKISAVKSLEKTQLIKIETVLEEENNVHVLYQYVPFKAEIKLQAISSQNARTEAIFQLKQQMLQLGDSLAEAKILLKQWNFNSLGMDKNNCCKFYLDLNKIQLQEQHSNHAKLKNQSYFNSNSPIQISKEIRRQHFQQINSMFKPYLGDKEQRQKEEKKSRRKNSQPTQDLMETHKNFKDQTKASQGKHKDQGLYQRQTDKKQFSPTQSHGFGQDTKNSIDHSKKNNNTFNPNNSYKKQSYNNNAKQQQTQSNQAYPKITGYPTTNDIIQTPSSTNIRRTKHNWKQIQQDSEILMDFINVLDDEPNQNQEQNSQSYDYRQRQESEQVDYNDQQEKNIEFKRQQSEFEKVIVSPESRNDGSSYNDENFYGKNRFITRGKFSDFDKSISEKKSQIIENQEEDEQVVWASPQPTKNINMEYIEDPRPQKLDFQKDQRYQAGKHSNQDSQEQEVIWHDENMSLLDRVEQAIQRSRNVIQVFKTLTKS